MSYLNKFAEEKPGSFRRVQPISTSLSKVPYPTRYEYNNEPTAKHFSLKEI
jgi:hypothetical protein